ncbi:hypothetical protein ULF88_24155 [Halopseudomonas pachastrellae]|nr:hypothetical protein [Halopseudomonas pachastrellae]MEB3736241.1 hypothetical protein [Halopseudomonas pachastrellae]MEB3736250.1 hypothetical protein [Halopseudomonas pachastrellae]|tara:strand:+ start:5179 stop:5385 length:207 start_codon:yes stop_codon:yes gene_type:complete
MALIDRDYMRRDQPTGSSSRKPNSSADVERLLKTVKPARLVPASRVLIALVIGILAGATGTYYLLPIL